MLNILFLISNIPYDLIIFVLDISNTKKVEYTFCFLTHLFFLTCNRKDSLQNHNLPFFPCE